MTTQTELNDDLVVDHLKKEYIFILEMLWATQDFYNQYPVEYAKEDLESNKELLEHIDVLIKYYSSPEEYENWLVELECLV